MSVCRNWGRSTVELKRTTPTTKNMRLQLMKLKFLNRWTSTMGSLWNHSQITSETRPTACVEHLHECGEGDNDPYEPWVDLRCLARICNGDSCCTTHCCFLSGIPQSIAAHTWRTGKSIADTPVVPRAHADRYAKETVASLTQRGRVPLLRRTLSQGTARLKLSRNPTLVPLE